MSSYIDLIIFFGFLAINLIVGIFAGRGNNTISDYALGDRKFSVGSIAGTLIATWIGAGFFLFSVSKIYTSGLPFIFIMIANGLMLLLLAIFYIPRMKGFLGNLSIASTMGNIYGKQVRVITAIAAICLAVGYVGIQIKVLSNLVSWITGSKGIYIVCLCSFIVTIYSALGGIRAVIYTDLVQFFTFGVFIPIITFILWTSLDNHQVVYNLIFSKEFLDYDYLFSLSWLSIFIWFILPCLDPSVFQRILMAKDTTQASRAFAIASISCVAIILFSAWLAVLVRSTGKEVNPDEIINYILHNYSYKGLIGLAAAGIAAMVMSTVDSYINTAAVMFSEDICSHFKIKLKNELVIAKAFSVLAGIVGIFFALSGSNLFDITLIISNFYVPIVTGPMTLAIFGFRSTPKSALIGIFGGITMVIIWRNFFQYTNIDSVIPGLFTNCILLIGSHYLLKQEGGWVGIKDNEPLMMIRQNRGRIYRKLLIAIKEFNLKKYLLTQAPNTESAYIYFGLFSLVSTISSMYFLPERGELVILFYQSVLTFSVMFMTYPLWPATIKSTNIFPLLWGFIATYALVIVGTYILLISSFGTIQLITFMVNLLVLAILLEWKFVIGNIIIGIYLGCQIYMLEYGVIDDNMGTIQFKILYVLLIVSAALIAFVKPKQHNLKYLEKLNKELKEQYNKKAYDLIKTIHHREEFINRFDEDCIQIFHQLGNNINEIYERFSDKSLSPSELQQLTGETKSVIERLKDGAEYLNSLVKSLKQVKLNITHADLYKILEDSNHEETIITQSFSSNIPIFCDAEKLGYCFSNLLNHAKKNTSKEIRVTIERDFLEYDISFNSEYKDKIKAYKVTIAIISDTLIAKEIANLLTPRLRTHDDIVFAEIASIIEAHYGKFIIESTEEMTDLLPLSYVVVIPVNVKEVRPKVADLKDSGDLNINKLYKLLYSHEKTTLLKVAASLYKEGMSAKKIRDITNLSQEEIELLKTL